MPFENTSIVVGLKGEQILEMLIYFIAENKPHPLSGIQFTISKTNQPIKISVQGKPLDFNKIYYVITSDYLSNGGDKMEFFKKGVEIYDINYKLRNILIDYFKETKNIDVIYHLVEDDVYHNYMNQLFSSSKKYVIIYSSNFDDLESNNVVAHVKHRKFSKWVEENISEFEFIKHIPNK